jgi:serine/threonine protein kinase
MFSLVYNEKHKDTGEAVAVKCISVDNDYMSDEHVNLEREVQTHKSLIHPNIVKLLYDDKHLWMVTEYCDQNNLNEYMKNHEVGIEKNPITHRDLKPQNMVVKIVDTQHVVKICDMFFSITLSVAEDNNALTVCGTPFYMSPDLWKPYGMNQDTSEYGVSTDIFLLSLGLLVYALVEQQPREELQPLMGGSISHQQ